MLLFPLSGRFDRLWSTTSGCTPDTRTEGGAGWMEGCSTEDRWRWREGGRIPSSPVCVCGSQAKEMLQPRREGISTWVTLTSPAAAGFCGGSNCTFLNGAELWESARTPQHKAEYGARCRSVSRQGGISQITDKKTESTFFLKKIFFSWFGFSWCFTECQY